MYIYIYIYILRQIHTSESAVQYRRYIYTSYMYTAYASNTIHYLSYK